MNNFIWLFIRVISVIGVIRDRLLMTFKMIKRLFTVITFI